MRDYFSGLTTYLLIELIKKKVVILRVMQVKSAAQHHLQDIVALELSSYPDDEAASPEKIEFRLKNANPYFLVCETQDGSLVGFVNGTLTKEASLTHHSMSHHDSDGLLLCIHSVVVDFSQRRKGIGSFLLKAYIEHIRSLSNVLAIELLCKADLRSFYEKAGFLYQGVSAVQHGSEQWLSMRLTL
jgi:GNAT superfamily N-acetyltransferase